MKAIIYNSVAHGSYDVIPSKSMLHRYIICASLADGKSIINNYQESDDVLATINAFSKFGIKFSKKDGALIIDSSGIEDLDEVVVDANESATTLRLLAPILIKYAHKVTFIGKPNLLNRPMDEYKKLFGSDIEVNDDKIIIKNAINGDTLYVDASVSSQFVSGVILASLLKRTPTTIIIQGKITSSSYIDLTINAAKSFGANIKRDENVIYVLPSRLESKIVTVEADYTHAASFIVLSKINHHIDIVGLNDNSLQADKAIYELLKQDEINLENNIDLGPILFCYAACRNKRTKFIGTNRLMVKESNRLQAMKEELAKFGVNIQIYDDVCFIDGKESLSTTQTLASHNDHRICMSLAILASICKNKVELDGIECVNKSYPNFFNDLKSLGIKIEII